MDLKKQIGEQIVDHLSDGANDANMAPSLKEWLDQNESNKKDFEQYKNIWIETGSYIEQEAFDTQRAWEKVNHTNTKKNNIRKRLIQIGYITSGVAASILCLFILSTTGIFDKQQEISVSMTADYGNRSEVTLPDGTKVQLNSGSNITYSYNPKKKVREVHFQGEGFFDVSKSKTPFVIKMANELQLKVWGTSFNLQAYEDDQAVSASLVEGCIELNHGKNKLIMNAGDMATFDKHTNEIKPVSGILSHSYSWLNDKLYMDHMSLATVCKYLERRYDVIITLQKDLGKKIHYDGVLQEQTITDILGVLSRLSNIDYTVKGKNISITSK